MSICNSCQFSNPEGMKFCGSCGNTLSNICSSCNFESPVDFKFCGNCGNSFESKTSVSEPRAKDYQHSFESNDAIGVSERRQLTVMFCDLADFTSLSDSIDPEELHSVIQQYQTACAEVIQHYGGHIAQYLGDGILVYFCYPRAYEDDPIRAVHSAVGCIESIEKLNKKLVSKGITLNIRIGIHTGLVVTGEIGSGEQREHLALGQTPNIAARLQNIAKPNSIFISETTLNLLHGHFETTFCGEHTLKGINNPVQVYQVLQENNTRDQMNVALQLGDLLPIVGRDNEIEQLSRLWGKVTDGDGQVVLLKGEGGVGKSRLMQAFIEQLHHSTHHYLCANGIAFSETSILRPIIAMLNNIFHFTASDTAEARIAKLEKKLEKYNFNKEECVPIFSSLLNISLSKKYTESILSAELKKRRTLEVVFEFVQKLSEERPLLFVVEDLHWLDPTTLEFLDMLVLQEQTHKIFVFLTCRPNFNNPWYTRSNLIQFNITHLKKTEITSMVTKLTGGRTLPKVLMNEIITRTDGVPLFIEELTKMVIKSDIVKEHDDHYELIKDFSSLSIPSTLQDLLNARLDSLGSAKEVAQLASIIGREFSFDLLLAISNYKPVLLQQGINRLVEAELLSQRGIGAQSVYIFKHALIHDAATSSMLKSRRQEIHKNLAVILENNYSNIAEEHPEDIAYHYSQGGKAEQAIDWWLKAEQHALKQSAYKEAISHFERGIALIETLPETKENSLRELRLCAVVGAAYCATTGYASPEVEKVFDRASTLLEKTGDIPEQFQILWGQYAFYVVRGDLDKARESSQVMLSAASEKDNCLMQLEAYVALGLSHYFKGDLKVAYEYMLKAEELDSPDRDRAFTYICGQDSSVGNLVYMGLALWLMGKPDEALKKSDLAIALARKIEHPFSVVYALNFSAWLHYMLGKRESAETLANEVITLSLEQGFFWVTLGSVIAGWSKVVSGEVAEGFEMMTSGLDMYRGAGAGLSQTLQLSIQADALLHENDLDKALEKLQEAIEMAEQSGENFWLADIYRLMGEALHRKGNVKAAEENLLKAISIASEQNLPMLLLRASTSYARLTKEENKPAALNQLEQALANISDDSGVLDIQNAKSLLETLVSS